MRKKELHQAVFILNLWGCWPQPQGTPRSPGLQAGLAGSSPGLCESTEGLCNGINEFPSSHLNWESKGGAAAAWWLCQEGKHSAEAISCGSPAGTGCSWSVLCSFVLWAVHQSQPSKQLNGCRAALGVCGSPRRGV